MDILNNVSGYSLSEEQKQVILSDNEAILLIAGAGSGKTLTIVGKVNYLLASKKIKPQDILVISFTNEACHDLKRKLNNEDVNVLTFHKLALQILRHINPNLKIAQEDELGFVVSIFLNTTIFTMPLLVQYILKYYKISFNRNNYLKKYSAFLKEVQYLKLEKTIVNFINLFKAHNYQIDYFKKIIYSSKKKDKGLLIIIYAIYLEYEKELYSRNTLDFHDMITQSIKVKKYPFHFKYIIVDEFQDTSLARCNLLQSLKNNMQAKIMVVGDDWQSIYGFNGCSLEVFLNFSKYFSNSKIFYLNHTYRNSQSLINIAGKFIMQNPNQIKKKLQASHDISKPLNYFYYTQIRNDLTKLIKKLNQEGTLFILGRNNQDIFKYLDLKTFKLDKLGNITFPKQTKRFIRFLTVHKAKGLESDNVIIINLENTCYGFPNKVKDEKILHYVKQTDYFPLAEERRIFYVALTRSKNKVYFYLPFAKISCFVKEIKKIRHNDGNN